MENSRLVEKKKGTNNVATSQPISIAHLCLLS